MAEIKTLPKIITASKWEYTKSEPISIASHTEVDEKWVHNLIKNDPSILGLGDVEVRDFERIQPKAGRLDLLLQEVDTNRRYEVEVQLGKTDESHIIRTLEYWDIEKKRYPQYDHCAVIVAEDITSRFLNVINMFNGHIPLVAIQMRAYQVNGFITIQFTKVLDHVERGLIDADEGVREPADRSSWELRSSKQMTGFIDDLFSIMKNSTGLNVEPNFTKHYIGILQNGLVNNFCLFQPRKKSMSIHFALDKEMKSHLEDNDIEILNYDTRFRRYVVRLNADELKSKRDFIGDLFRRSVEFWEKA